MTSQNEKKDVTSTTTKQRNGPSTDTRSAPSSGSFSTVSLGASFKQQHQQQQQHQPHHQKHRLEDTSTGRKFSASSAVPGRRTGLIKGGRAWGTSISSSKTPILASPINLRSELHSSSKPVSDPRPRSSLSTSSQSRDEKEPTSRDGDLLNVWERRESQTNGSFSSSSSSEPSQSRRDGRSKKKDKKEVNIAVPAQSLKQSNSKQKPQRSSNGQKRQYEQQEKNDSRAKSTGRESGMGDSTSLETLQQSDSWAALDADEEMVFDEELEAMIKLEQEKKPVQRVAETEKHSDTTLGISPKAPQKNMSAVEKRADTQITILPKQRPHPQSQQQQQPSQTAEKTQQENPWKLNSSTGPTPPLLEVVQKEEAKVKKRVERQRVEPRRIGEDTTSHHSRGRDTRSSRGPIDRRPQPIESKQLGPMIQPRTILKREIQTSPPRQRIVLAPVLQNAPSVPARQHILAPVTPILPSSAPKKQTRRSSILQPPELDIKAVETQSERMERLAEQARQKRLEEEERLENERKERAKAKLLALEKKLEEKRRAAQPQSEDKKEEKEAIVTAHEAREKSMAQRVDQRRSNDKRQRRDRDRSKRQPTPDGANVVSTDIRSSTEEPVKDHAQPENRSHYGKDRNHRRNSGANRFVEETGSASKNSTTVVEQGKVFPRRRDQSMKKTESLASSTGRDTAANQTEKEKTIVKPQSISTNDKDEETGNEITTQDHSDDGEWVEMKSKRQKWVQKKQGKRGSQQKEQKKERMPKAGRVATPHGSSRIPTDDVDPRLVLNTARPSIDTAPSIQFGTLETESLAKHDHSSNTNDALNAKLSKRDTGRRGRNAHRLEKERTQKLPSENPRPESRSHSHSRKSRSKQGKRSSKDKRKIRYVEE